MPRNRSQCAHLTRVYYTRVRQKNQDPHYEKVGLGRIDFIGFLDDLLIYTSVFSGIVSEKFGKMLIVVIGIREDEEVYEIASDRRKNHNL